MTDLKLLHGERGIETDEYRIAVLTASRNQWTELYGQDCPQVTCPCGKTLSVVRMYRCLHCGLWWCKKCAKLHFGAYCKPQKLHPALEAAIRKLRVDED